MFRIGIAVVTVFLTAACTSQSASSASPSSPGAPTTATSETAAPAQPLVDVGQSKGTSYTLKDLSSCQVTDALTVVANTAGEPLSVAGASLRTGLDSASAAVDLQVLPVPAGSTPGSLAAVSTARGLDAGTPEPLIGASLAPSGSDWYMLVAHVHLTRPVTTRWSISGFSVTLGDPAHTSLFFPQAVSLAPAPRCGKAG